METWETVLYTIPEYAQLLVFVYRGDFVAYVARYTASEDRVGGYWAEVADRESGDLLLSVPAGLHEPLDLFELIEQCR